MEPTTQAAPRTEVKSNRNLAWEPIAQFDGGTYNITCHQKCDALGHLHFAIETRAKALNGNAQWMDFEDADFQSIQEIADALGHLLSSGYTPEWCRRLFR